MLSNSLTNHVVQLTHIFHLREILLILVRKDMLYSLSQTRTNEII